MDWKIQWLSKLKISLFERVTGRKLFHSLCALQVAITASTSEMLRTWKSVQLSYVDDKNPNSWAIPCCSPMHISRELHCKPNTWNLNWCSRYRIMACWLAAYPIRVVAGLSDHHLGSLVFLSWEIVSRSPLYE